MLKQTSSASRSSTKDDDRFRKFSTLELAVKARLRGERELMCMFWGRWRELMRVWNYMKSLRHEVQRRTLLLDEVRDRYLKDVWAVKSGLDMATQGNRKAAGSGPDGLSSKLASSSDGAPSLDLRGFGNMPTLHQEKFKELETRGYLALAGIGEEDAKKSKGYEILEEKTVPAYAPNECAFLAHHCESCQGVLALVYARNQRVSAALGLVANYEELKASTKDQLARIPGLEKQAKQLREQVVTLGASLGASELRVSDLEDELRNLNRKYEEDMGDLQKRHDAQEKIASKVPGLEERLSVTEAKLKTAEEEAESSKLTVDRLELAIRAMKKEVSENKGETEKAIQGKDGLIANMKTQLREKDEALKMLFEELWHVREVTVPNLRIERGEIQSQFNDSEAQRKVLELDLDDTKLKLQLALRRGDMMLQQLAECRADLEDALRKPESAEVEVQATPKTADNGTTFKWVEHLTPQKPNRIRIVSRSVVALCEAAPEVIARQLVTTMGQHMGVQASPWGEDGPQDKEVSCVLQTPMEAKLEGELEDALDRLESCEAELAAERKRHETTKVKLKLAELECDDATQEKEDALALVETIESSTSERLTSHWQSKFTIQSIVNKFMMNTQQKLTQQLADMMNQMKGRITLQSKFLGALTEGKTKAAHDVVESKKSASSSKSSSRSSSPRSIQTPEVPRASTAPADFHSPKSSPTANAAASAFGAGLKKQASERPKSEQHPRVQIVHDEKEETTAVGDDYDKDEDEEEEGSDGGSDDGASSATESLEEGEVLQLGGHNGDASKIDDDANALQKFGAVLEEKIEELTLKSKEADREVAQLRFLLMTSQNQVQTKNLELLKLKTRISLTVDELVEEKAKNEKLEAELAAAREKIKSLEDALAQCSKERGEARSLAAERLRLINEATVLEQKLREQLATLQEKYDGVTDQMNASLSIASNKLDELSQERDLLLADKALLTQAVQDSYRTHCVEMKKVFLDNMRPTRSVGTQLDCCVCAMRTATDDPTLLPTYPDQQQQSRASSSSSVLSSSSQFRGGASRGGGGARGAFRSMSTSTALRDPPKPKVTIVVDKTGQRYPFATGTGAARPVISATRHVEESTLGVHLPPTSKLGTALEAGKLAVASHPKPPHYLVDPGRGGQSGSGSSSGSSSGSGCGGCGSSTSLLNPAPTPKPWALDLPSERHKRALANAQSSTEGLSFEEAFEWSNQRVLLGGLDAFGLEARSPHHQPLTPNSASAPGTATTTTSGRPCAGGSGGGGESGARTPIARAMNAGVVPSPSHRLRAELSAASSSSGTSSSTGGGGVGSGAATGSAAAGGGGGGVSSQGVGGCGGSGLGQGISMSSSSSSSSGGCGCGAVVGAGGSGSGGFQPLQQQQPSGDLVGDIGSLGSSSSVGGASSSSSSSSTAHQDLEQERLLRLLKEERRRAEAGVHNGRIPGGSDKRSARRSSSRFKYPLTGSAATGAAAEGRRHDELQFLSLPSSARAHNDKRRGSMPAPGAAAAGAGGAGLSEPLSPLILHSSVKSSPPPGSSGCFAGPDPMAGVSGADLNPSAGGGGGAAAPAATSGRPRRRPSDANPESDIMSSFSFQPSFSSLSPPAPPKKSVSTEERAMTAEGDN